MWTWYRLSRAERAELRVMRLFWWAVPMKNTLDVKGFGLLDERHRLHLGQHSLIIDAAPDR